MSRKPIVVGYDGSAGSRAALEFAIEVARPGGLPIEVVHSWLPPLPPPAFARSYADPPVSVVRAGADMVLGEALEAARSRGLESEVHGHLVEGPASASLIEAAADAHMVVVGSRGLGGFGALVLGSTGLQVAGHAKCPVVVLRPSGGVVAAGPESGRVVVGVDGSRTSERALGFAFEQASWLGVGLTAVHAWEIPYVNLPGVVGSIPENVVAAEEKAASAVLDASLAGWSERFPDVEVTLRAEMGGAGSALLHVSRGARLLVVGSRGRGGFASLVLGSVSHAVLHHAQVPVAVVHPSAA